MYIITYLDFKSQRVRVERLYVAFHNHDAEDILEDRLNKLTETEGNEIISIVWKPE